MAAAMDLSEFEKDPRLFLFTSLTAGSSHIITATSRLETILKANKIPFQAIDIATDEKARRLWQRRAGKKKLPGLVKDGFVLGDLEEIEEWNEFGELKENIGDVPSSSVPPPAGARQGVNLRPVESTSPRQTDDSQSVDVRHPSSSETASALLDSSSRIALPGAAEIAARNKAQSPTAGVAVESPEAVETVPSAPTDKTESAPAASNEPAKEGQPPADRLSPSSVPDEAGEPPSVRLHRGSEVRLASVEEIRKHENENALMEHPAEDQALEETTKDLEAVKLDQADAEGAEKVVLGEEERSVQS
ncbi:hypothetical protein BDY17DRAFT_301314 [Neohortaea acidophila]|uniref:Uncharacterized protein n=1 Tax=Neohortaea acidophila TaxID=245834 RepID=A0A6A6PP02_9PEZI|nr:uncharacterized protein BDY17DRAFT_301314 [Neohortaea acidophila]KAF2481421.1 hypothetical protein BDY17DRAFT_301314 [Neohortaea acidophila]